MTTVYPSAIDGYSEIRIVRDNIEEIIADDHNDLRSAVIALEQTLGINPQGAFGSVNARLNDSYANIEGHADGQPPRHIDSHIDSPLRTSSPYSLSLGTVATQLNEILTFLNASTKYGGSGTTTFADGYALPSAYITSTITQIINQLGTSIGSSKIGGAVTTSSPTDANTPPYNLTTTTLRNQLISLLTYINNYNLSTGAANIGAAGFSSESDSKYTFSGSNVQDQIEETGSFLNEHANLLERALDTFVSDGMAVTQYGGGPNASVASGFIISDGRLLKYNGGTITVSVTPGSYYIYARIFGGSVSVASASSLPFSTTNPIVILHKITHSGGAWSASIDMRRYGIFINDKSCFTVGSTPSSGNDGYGCDFTTLRGAIEYIKVMNASNIVFAPKKIRLVNDISYSGTTITIDVEGLEIDGAGRKILLSSDIPLFTINVNNVKLENISVESNIVGTPASASLAKIGNTVSINGIQVSNCIINTGGGYSPLAYFTQCGSNTTTVSNSLFSNNFADVTKGGLDSIASVGSGTSIIDSVIEGNRFYQTSFSTEDGYGIRASARCAIANNIISGGYKTGIFCTLAERTNVNGNILTGYSAASGIVMNNGIAFYNSALGQDSNALIEGNTIFGINNYGINCRTNATGSGAFMMVSDNIINNYYAGTPPSSMIGIQGRGNETWVVNNKIVAPGQFGIMNANHIISNQIYGITSITTTTAAIQGVASATEGSLISDNWVYNCAGDGIDVNSATRSIIGNNIILNLSNTVDAGIDNLGSKCTVSNNIINYYDVGIRGSVSGSNTIISNNYINDFTGHGIDLSNYTYCEIFDNQLIANYPNHAGGGIYGVGISTIIANNFLANLSYGGGSYYAITTDSGSDYEITIINNVIYYSGSSNGGGIYAAAGGSNIVIAGNSLIGVPNVGINLSDAENAFINNNFLMGKDAVSSPTNGIIGVDGYSVISNNFIYDYGSNSTDTAIKCTANSRYIAITNNKIMENQGIGIDCNGGSTGGWTQILGNYLNGNDDAASGIINIQEQSIISDNLISNFGYISNSYGIISATSAGKLLISNNLITNSGPNMLVAIDLAYDISQLVIGNVILQTPQVGINVNSGAYNIISNNVIEGKGTGISNHYAIYDTGNANFINNNYIKNPNFGGISISGTFNNCLGNYIIITSAGNAISINSSSNYSKINGNFIYSVSSGYGIKAESSSNLSICDNYVINPSIDGIHGDTTNDIQIIGNVITGASDDGIQVQSSDRAHVCSNRISSCSYGIYVSSGVKHLIGNNYIYNTTTGFGIFCNSSGLSTLSLITGNKISTSASYGIGIAGNYISVTNNHIDSTTTDGITVTNGTHLIISNNHLYSLGSDGIDASASGVLADSVVNGNCIISANSGSANGIKANSTAHRCTMSGNYIQTCYYGITTSGSDDIVVSNNIVLDYSYTAYHISGASDCLIIGNRATSPASAATNCWGIDMHSGVGYLAIGNWVEGKGTGTAVYTGGTTSYLILGNLSEGGFKPASFSGPPVGTQVINNWEVYS